MDPLSHLLSGIRAEGSVLTHAVLAAPWTIRFADRAPLTMVTVLRGGGVLVLGDGTVTPLAAGDTVVVRDRQPFYVADRPDSIGGPHTEYEIACFTPDPACEAEDLSGIRWGGSEDGATALLVGAYRTSARRHQRLVESLPRTLLIREDLDGCEWVESAAAQAVAQSAGSQAMMDRLLDWNLVCTLRQWFADAGPDAPAWYRGLNDPVLAPALEIIHTGFAAPWTVASLAARAGVSRALFAKRFTTVMGTPPLAYLTARRMEEAEELLTATDFTTAQVAAAVGYADAFGFSAAFKRHTGSSPTAFRTAA
ncbi:AraC family transcriptional regulator [Nocardia sp. NPDC020380]|uniref:AraC family transcriptional regulator n=1 Tax=Nocardia sp. NPDC020380 TaxID=3364309 RepID=UPI003796F2E1